MTRRSALVSVVALLGLLKGRPVQAQRGGARGWSVNLDDTDGIVVSYRGQTRVVTPSEIMQALSQKEP